MFTVFKKYFEVVNNINIPHTYATFPIVIDRKKI